MNFRSPWLVAIAAFTLLAPGCTGLFAKRAIEHFAENLQQQDLDKLKTTTSDDFKQKALRQEDSAKGLKMLKLPMGKVEIISVEDLPDGKRKVMVNVGEKGKTKELEYRLAYSRERGRWVVDDVIMRQDSGAGIMVERSVSEQMDLLLTCRELLLSWKDGTADEKLNFCDEELKQQLSSLPPKWLERLTREIAGSGRQGTFKPDARMKGDRAFVIVPHTQGNLFLEMRQTDERWILHDLSMEPTSKESTGIRSLSTMILALNQAARFLTAYAGADRQTLSQTATSEFYSQCLSAARLEDVPLPVPALLSDAYEARQFTDGTEVVKRMELLLRDGQETYMLTLQQQDVANAAGTAVTPEYRVQDVTVFQKDEKEFKRLSSLFLSHAVVHLYTAALRDRDITKLKELSSSDFNDRVWNRPEAMYFRIMPEPEIADGDAEIISTVFRGDVSEVTLTLGETPLTLVLHLARGWMMVDDVLMPALDRPTSLKQNLEGLLSVHAFASAVHRKDLNGLIKFSADGFDRIVWRQLSEVPELTQQLVRPMMSEVVAIVPQDGWTIVRTSDGQVQAEVKLVREGSNMVIHDVALISVEHPQQRLDYLQTFRQMIAAGQLGPAADLRRARALPAAAQQAQSPAAPRAAFEPIDPAVYTR